MHATRRFIKIIGVLLAVTVVGAYGVFEFREYFGGPKVTLSFPENGVTVLESALDVTGTAYNIARITLNGRPIFIDETGAFDERVVLLPGYNRMTLIAADRFENETKIIREIVFRGELPSVVGTTTPHDDGSEPPHVLSPET